MHLLCILSPVYRSPTCSENSQAASTLTIHSISPWHLQRITCSKSYIIEPKALCMCWATQPVWSLDRTQSAKLIAQADCNGERLDLHPTPRKPISVTCQFIHAMTTQRPWLKLWEKSVRCYTMVRMWKLGTGSTSRYLDWSRVGISFLLWCTQLNGSTCNTCETQQSCCRSLVAITSLFLVPEQDRSPVS